MFTPRRTKRKDDAEEAIQRVSGSESRSKKKGNKSSSTSKKSSSTSSTKLSSTQNEQQPSAETLKNSRNRIAQLERDVLEMESKMRSMEEKLKLNQTQIDLAETNLKRKIAECESLEKDRDKLIKKVNDSEASVHKAELEKVIAENEHLSSNLEQRNKENSSLKKLNEYLMLQSEEMEKMYTDPNSEQKETQEMTTDDSPIDRKKEEIKELEILNKFLIEQVHDMEVSVDKLKNMKDFSIESQKKDIIPDEGHEAYLLSKEENKIDGSSKNVSGGKIPGKDKAKYLERLNEFIMSQFDEIESKLFDNLKSEKRLKSVILKKNLEFDDVLKMYALALEKVEQMESSNINNKSIISEQATRLENLRKASEQLLIERERTIASKENEIALLLEAMKQLEKDKEAFTNVLLSTANIEEMEMFNLMSHFESELQETDAKGECEKNVKAIAKLESDDSLVDYVDTNAINIQRKLMMNFFEKKLKNKNKQIILLVEYLTRSRKLSLGIKNKGELRICRMILQELLESIQFEDLDENSFHGYKNENRSVYVTGIPEEYLDEVNKENFQFDILLTNLKKKIGVRNDASIYNLNDNIMNETPIALNDSLANKVVVQWKRKKLRFVLNTQT